MTVSFLPSDSSSSAAEVLLGYLNFSEGRPDPTAQSAANQIFSEVPFLKWIDLSEWLTDQLQMLAFSRPAFREPKQAQAVVEIVCEELVPAYLAFHSDLLFHLTETELLNPFFFIRLAETVLAIGAPWSERETIVTAALQRINDYVGHRPVAILENRRKGEIYPHERFRPLPLYLKGAGAAVGRYADLMNATLDHLRATSTDLAEEAGFQLDRVEELALDYRAYDALHPVFKRTNYLFGEWDPFQIDSRGFYRRFIVRRPIIEALLRWIEGNSLPREEALHDAGAVLCGTLLMASAISGAGPAAFDSSVSLSSLLPVVARQRDEYYARLMARLTGPRTQRLEAVRVETRQPFGHVRQQLNLHLADIAAEQLQRRAVAELFARMGYGEAARRQAEKIPAVSSRFECELNVSAESATRLAEMGRASEAADQLSHSADLLQRGIHCGALVDPWNILAFQGHYPLFQTREDAVLDHRIEWLVLYMERLFTAGARSLAEAAATGDVDAVRRIADWFAQVAAWWDKYATTTIHDLPSVSGAHRAEAAMAVAETLSEWQAAGATTGDLAFWRERVGRLQTPAAYADVVRALLQRRDLHASLGLLIQWLSNAEEIGLGEGPHAFFELAPRWLTLLTSGSVPLPITEQASLGRRFFDFLEANAGEFIQVPAFGESDRSELGIPDASDDEENLFGAAYEDVVFRDSTADGNEGNTLEGGSSRPGDGSEFEARFRLLEPRLQFLDTLARMWRLAAGRLAPASQGTLVAAVENWRKQAKRLATDLCKLAHVIQRSPLGTTTGNFDANVEYDAQLQAKNHLLHLVVATAVRMESSHRLLTACSAQGLTSTDSLTISLRAILDDDGIRLRREVPRLLAQMLTEPLLYVAVENGGDPSLAIDARLRQDLFLILVTELPRLGLLRLTRHVLLTALRMERRSRPPGLAVTEYDRLYRTACRTVLAVVSAAIPDDAAGRIPLGFAVPAWRDNPSQPARVQQAPKPAGRRVAKPRSLLTYSHERRAVALIQTTVDSFLELWLRHSETMRLTAVEALADGSVWGDVKRFIRTYGTELFHARLLPLSNIRAVLHGGVEQFLDEIIANDDPLNPSKFVAACEDPELRREAERCISLVYAAVADEIERFYEYNSTTIQSDYGDQFDSFLDFLRVEAAYRRDEWNLTPYRLAHEVLAAAGRDRTARLWEDTIRRRTAAVADRHMNKLKGLERRHAMRLPSIADHLAERFAKPLAIDRMVAFAPGAVRDARLARSDSSAFRGLRREVDAYLDSSHGSAAELPEWLQRLDQAVSRALDASDFDEGDHESLTGRPIPHLKPHWILQQLLRMPGKGSQDDIERWTVDS